MGSILVTGGTGRLGSEVVARLTTAGHEVRIASRRARPAGWDRPYDWQTVDYGAGTGLDAAMAGVDTVVHCVEAHTVIDRAARSGAHLVYISIVGVDRVPLGYYRTKLETERVIARSGGPHTILRATQFHDLLRLVLSGLSRSPVMPVPNLPFQPIDVTDVAARLAELAESEPMGRAPDIGGPRVESLPDLAKVYLAATNRRRLVMPIRLPGKVFRGYRDGGHMTPEHAVPGRTFAEYLAAHESPATLHYRPRW